MRRPNILKYWPACAGAAAITLLSQAALAQAQAVIGWTDRQQERRLAQFAELGPEHFLRTSTIKDDDLETVATINTAPGYTFKGGFTDRVRGDSFLRAFINKRTGRVTYQLYAIIGYTGQWRTFESATFATPDGPVTGRLQLASRKVDCPYSVCVYTEDVGVELTEDFVRQLGSAAAAKPVRPWRFRFKAKSGEDWTDDMAPAEAAGLILAVDRYRQEHRLP